MDPISIFSITCNAFADEIGHRLGKGKQHAALLYSEWFRTGQALGSHPAFNNARSLYRQILDHTDFTLPSFLDKRLDGETGKILLKTHDHLEIETVVIPMQAGFTLCVSSQVGCKMGCSFCETARMGLLRSLTASEIVSQLFVARFVLQSPIRNIVFMGMGEPFDNYAEVMQAVRVMSDPHGLGFGMNHITISTSGRSDGISQLMKEEGAIPNLAVSLNAPNDALRNKLMPINRSVPLDELHRVLLAFCQKTGKEILIAYVLLAEVNDELEHAAELAKYLRGLSVKINLIPYNHQSRERYQSSAQEKIDAFATFLRKAGYHTLIRQTKGDNIMAACGQLGNVKLRRQRQPLRLI